MQQKYINYEEKKIVVSKKVVMYAKKDLVLAMKIKNIIK